MAALRTRRFRKSPALKDSQEPFFSKRHQQRQEREGATGAAGDRPFFTPAVSTPAPTVQSKLTIGKPNDMFEREADATANTVVNQITNPTSTRSSGTDIQAKEKTTLQRQTNEEEAAQTKPQLMKMEEEEAAQTKPQLMKMEEEEAAQTKPQLMKMEEEEAAQTKPNIMAMEEEEAAQPKSQSAQQPSQASPQAMSTDAISQRLKQRKGKGHPLQPHIQAEMKAAFGRDFKHVRIHTDQDAIELNTALNAQAFTHGHDIYFNQGKFDPDSDSGKRLLAHELTHVVQQGQTI